jgi:hypothetical protein
MSRLFAVTGIAAGGLLAITGLAMPAANASPTAQAFPTHVSAPYVDTGLSNTTLTSVASADGTKYFTLAFVDGANCQWSMPNSSGWQSQVSALRSAGGDVAISFGGYTSDTNGTDLGNACSSADAAATQIEAVVTTFSATRLDFDIESSELTNTADITKTNQALAKVKSWASGNGTPLSISYTIPTAPTGLTSDGTALLANGKSNGFTPDLVNVMTMDYGSSGTEMGDAANQGLDAVAGQVASAYGVSSSQAYGMLGTTPMIGQNDSAGEVFSLSDASSVVSHAKSQGIAQVSFWAEGRDNGGCAGQTTASSTCSGVSQNDGDFTKAFQQFAG